MENTEETDLDQASIKPVASLRSLFEGKKNDDYPLKPPSTLVSRPKLGLCPLSTTSLYIPPSAPSTELHTPLNSSRNSSSHCAEPSLGYSTPRNPKLINVRSQPPKALPTESEFPNRNLATNLTISGEPGIRNGQKAKYVHEAVDDISAQKSARGPPPPINRADKPKVPSKSEAVSNKSNLEPHSRAIENRLSPFSTPPSSDESFELQYSVLDEPGKMKREDYRMGINAKVHGWAPGPTRSVDAAQQTGDSIVPRKIKQLDARGLGFTQTATSHNIKADAPPGLPPRRGQGQKMTLKEEADAKNGANAMAANASSLQGSAVIGSELDLPLELRPLSKRSPTCPSLNVAYSRYITSVHAADQSVGHELPHSFSHPDQHGLVSTSDLSQAAEFPDVSNSNRRPPYMKKGAEEISTGYSTRHVDICGRYVATTGYLTKVWDVISGHMVLDIDHREKDVRMTSLAFKPASTINEEGTRFWLGSINGDIQEWNVLTQNIVHIKMCAHERREVVKMHRHQSSMWTIDDGGRLCVWSGHDTGFPDLQHMPQTHKVPRGYTFSIIVQDDLWFAAGKEISIFRPYASEENAFEVLQTPLTQPGVGAVTSGAINNDQLDRIYFGHADGKVTIYSTETFSCVGIVCLSVYKINCMAGVGYHLWAGYNTGMVYVFDTRTKPWTNRKDWLAHSNPSLNILVDRSSLWSTGYLRVISLGADNVLRFWDGTIEDDWLENDMHDRESEYCSFHELKGLLISWNAGATTPNHLRYNQTDSLLFRKVLQADTPPDLLVFGFQELVDLEDKKLTAKTLFKGNKKKDPAEQEHMSRQYRVWRDYLVRCVEDAMPSNEAFHLLHTASMVGLFSCIFIKASLRSKISGLHVAEIKRGMGGLHGNKGALIIRFFLEDTSVCLVNCHLAAGQSQTANRNNDVTAILESSALFPSQPASPVSNIFVGGGDGSMVLDHEVCILSGDLNYRIDTMGRDTVIKAINANNLSKLLERDQLLVSRKRNPGFRARSFKESLITFAPTYKYDIGADRYDTSEKRRAPAWCDRILYRGAGKIKQTDYRRHELRVSDHRPISGRFEIRIKSINVGMRATIARESKERFDMLRQDLATKAKVEYLRDVLGVAPSEARRII